MNRWALHPTDTFIGRHAPIGTSMAMGCTYKIDACKAPPANRSRRIVPPRECSCMTPSPELA